MTDDIDNTDYAILQCLCNASKPVWKKEIHVRIQGNITCFPGIEGVSVQTVGRHVDKLHDLAYLESCVVSPENLNRDLIISYKLTEDGFTALREKRESLLKSRIMTPEDTDKQELLTLLHQEIGFNDEMQSFLADRDTPELIGLAEIYYMRKYLDQKMNPEMVEKLQELAADQEILPKQITR